MFVSVPWCPTVQAAVIICAPTSGFNTCKRITFLNADQAFTVPNGVTSLDVRAWGGAGGGANSSHSTLQGGGAGGGYATGTVPVSGGQVLGVITGQGGVPNSTASPYGFGGPGGNSTNAVAIGGSGGGLSGVFSSTTVNHENSLVIAGGGGGGSPGADNNTPSAGGGGGTVGGQDAVPASSGRGGTQSAGGAAATTNSACSTLPTAGAAGNGGVGSSPNGSGSNEAGGGGGGGGYWGGGGGMCQTNAINPNGAGGGGSGFTAGSVTAASMTNGSNFPYSGNNCAGTANSGGASDTLYTSGIGQGSCYGTGGNGEVVIQYHMASITLTMISNGGVGGFTFTGINGWTSQTITTVTTGVGVTGATQVLAAGSTATNITLTIPSGYLMSNAACSGMGSGTMTPTYSTGLMAFDATATSAANDITCTVTATKTPTFKLQVTTTGGFGGPFTFTQTNLASTPAGITTAAASTPTPASPTVTNVSTIGTAATVTETLASNFIFTSATCTDTNNVITGNTGNFGTVAGTTLTISAAKVVAGADFTCVFTDAQVNSALTITKTYATATTPVVFGNVITYTYFISNNGNVPMTNVSVKDLHGSPAIQVSLGAGGITSETLTVAGPSGAGASPDTTPNDGVWSTLAPGATVKFTFTYNVMQGDVDHG